MIKLTPELMMIATSDFRSMFFEVRRIANDSYRIIQKKKIETTSRETVTTPEKNLIVKTVVEALNKATGKHYKYNTRTTKSAILSRLSEGFSLNDFLLVISKQVDKWKGTKAEIYLRPETLFGNKMDGYLNAPATPPPIEPNQLKSKEIAERIINALNSQTGKNYLVTNDVIDVIVDRFKEGLRIKDFAYVIQNESTRWLGTDKEYYLAPKNLFGKNMHVFVNNRAYISNDDKKSYLENIAEQTQIAKQNATGKRTKKN
jgi:uncharacterized phage protein (TIGR02220 family)